MWRQEARVHYGARLGGPVIVLPYPRSSFTLFLRSRVGLLCLPTTLLCRSCEGLLCLPSVALEIPNENTSTFTTLLCHSCEGLLCLPPRCFVVHAKGCSFFCLTALSFMRGVALPSTTLPCAPLRCSPCPLALAPPWVATWSRSVGCGFGPLAGCTSSWRQASRSACGTRPGCRGAPTALSPSCALCRRGRWVQTQLCHWDV